MTALRLYPANPYPLGVQRAGKAIRASVVSDERDCGVIFYNSRKEAAAPIRAAFPEEYRAGHVYSMKIEGIPASYDTYRIYKGERLVADEYGASFEPMPYGELRDGAQALARLVDRDFDWGEDCRPMRAFSEAFFYCLHVRGFTMGRGSKCRYKGTFKGVQEKLDYLQALGVTSLILMPAYEFIENEAVVAPVAGGRVAHMPQARTAQLNYWGYKKGYYYAPKAAYAAGRDSVTEMKELIKACHARGMELLMQFYFAEDTLEAEICRVLEFWTTEYHVDGFQILAEHINMDIISSSPILAESKLIYKGFGERALAIGATGAAKSLCTYRDDVMYDYRRFLKGDEYTLEPMMHHIRKNHEAMAHLNSVADYQGFRLADVVSYNYKHNEANGEKNSDGSNYNCSWNCGEEGFTRKRSVLQLRNRQIKNALCMVFLSQGTPYLFMGDEMGQSQQGNNNPYNQDNEISWLDWSNLDRNHDIYEFVQGLAAYRAQHPILRMDKPLLGTDYKCLGYPDISFHGLEPYKPNFEPYSKELGVLLCGQYARTPEGEQDGLIYVAFNMHWEEHTFALPRLRKGEGWQIAFSTSAGELCVTGASEESYGKKDTSDTQEFIAVPPRTVVVLEA